MSGEKIKDLLSEWAPTANILILIVSVSDSVFSPFQFDTGYWRYFDLSYGCAPLMCWNCAKLCQEKVMSWFTTDQSECNIIRIRNSRGFPRRHHCESDMKTPHPHSPERIFPVFLPFISNSNFLIHQ